MLDTKRTVAALAAFSMLLLSACGQTPAEPAEDPVPAQETVGPVYDTTGRYALSANGEAIIDDELYLTDHVTDDNCRVFYELFTGSFSDSDGDGTGDLRGIINRFDYLNDGDPDSGLSLGIEGIWLTPVFESVSYHKYDVTDYYKIDPAFGTEDDLKELIGLCHSRNVKLILDLPVNHTGTACEWFQAFAKAHRDGDTDSEYYNMYSWYSESSPEHGKGTYRLLQGTDVYYEGNFDGGMPELNYDAPGVSGMMLDVARYWLDLGVDGFRFDAAKYIYYGDNEACAEFWDGFSGTLRSEYPGIYIVYEVWDSDSVTRPYNSSGSVFDFTVSGAEGLIASTAKKGDVNRYTNYVQKYLASIGAEGDDALYTPFIANHDMDRASGYLTVAGRQAFMGANILILGPGSPFIYYGEEIGLKGSRGSANTDANRRLAMLWGDGDTVADPEGTTYDASKQTNGTVAWSLGRGDSLYNHYKKLIMIRNANPEIARGTFTALNFGGIKLGGFTSEWNGSTVAVIHNTSSSAVSVDLSEATSVAFSRIRAAIGDGSASLDGTVLTVDANTSVVLGA